MANAFLSGYSKRKYRGFVANDVLKANWAKLIVGYDGAGTDADAKVYNLGCRSDFNDFALVRFTGSATNTRQKEWREKYTADTSADKWFKVTEAYSSVLTGNADAAQAVVNVNDAGSFAVDDWVVITRDSGVNEFLQVQSKSINAITMKTNLVNAYTTADNAKLMLGYYVYYDDSDDATDYQDGANVFTVFDDFERGNDGDDIATNSDWTNTQGSPQIDTAQKWGGTRSAFLPIGTGASRSLASIPVTPSDDITIRFRYRKGGSSTWVWYHGDGSIELGTRIDASENLFVYNGASYVDTGLNGLADSWGLWETQNFRWSTVLLDMALDGNTDTNIDYSWANAGANCIFYWYGAGAGSGMWIDDFIVRNYPDISGAGFGAEQESHPLAGVSAGVATAGAAAKISKEIAGIIAGIATVSGLAKATWKLASVVTGLASVTAASKISKKLAAVSTGIASVTGALLTYTLLIGTSIGTSTAAATVKAARSLAGISAGVATAIANMGLYGVHFLSVVINGITTVSAAIKKTKFLAAITNGIATVTVATRIAKKLVITSAGSTIVTGISKTTRRLGVAIAGIAAVTGFSKVSKKISVAISGVTSTSGTLNFTCVLAGLSAGVSSVIGMARIGKEFIVTSFGTSTVAGFSRIAKKIAGTSIGITSTAIVVRITKTLATVSSGITTAGATLKANIYLAGLSAGVALVSARVKLIRYLKIISAGVSTAGATLTKSWMVISKTVVMLSIKAKSLITTSRKGKSDITLQ